jgi:hypothetical protein
MVNRTAHRALASRNEDRVPEEDTLEGQQYGYKYYATVGYHVCLCDSFYILDVWPGGRVGILPSAHSAWLRGIAFHFHIPGVEPNNIGVCGLYFLPQQDD